MSVVNRVAIQACCNEIERLVGDQDFDFGYGHGNVRIVILSGKKAEDHAEFMKAVGAYVNNLDDEDDEDEAKVKVAIALEKYLATLK
jgi:hypothetical protein